MKAASNAIKVKVMEGHALVSAVSYSLRYDEHHFNPTCAESPTKVLNLWKSCVQSHFLLYLRYIHSDSQIQKLQACLNRSRSSTLHVYGHATALLAEVGIPPLHITQNLQLAQFRYRLSTNQNNIIPHTLYVREQHAQAIMHDDTMGRRIHQAICQVDKDKIDPHTPMIPSVQPAKPQNREKSYMNILEKQCSKQWMQYLQSELLGPPGRLRAYVHWDLSSDTWGRNLYRPAPYLTHQNAKYQLEIISIQTQSWIDYIPSHLHYQRGPADQTPYQDRLCPLCLPAAGPVLADEKHIISQCPASLTVLHDPKFLNRFQGLTRLIDTQPFQLLDSEEQIRVALRNSPLFLMRKDFQTCRQEATVMCGEFAHALRMHLRPLQPIVPSLYNQ